jgi:hypothetical protein
VLAQQRRRKPHLHGLWFGLTMTWYRLHHRLEKLYATSAQLMIGCTQFSRSFHYNQATASDRTWTNCRGHMESAAALPEGASSVLHSNAGLSRPSCTELHRAAQLPCMEISFCSSVGLVRRIHVRQHLGGLTPVAYGGLHFPMICHGWRRSFPQKGRSSAIDSGVCSTSA